MKVKKKNKTEKEQKREREKEKVNIHNCNQSLSTYHVIYYHIVVCNDLIQCRCKTSVIFRRVPILGK